MGKSEMSGKEMDRGCILIIGGAKSGKSRYALDLCGRFEKKRKVFLATAQAWDEEMEERIRRHKEERGPDWGLVEEPLKVAEVIRTTDRSDTVILLDCMTLWLNNLFMKHENDEASIREEMDGLAAVLSEVKGVVVLVANEVGLGIVPGDPLSRKYRDVAGAANQALAGLSRKVFLVAAGLPLALKDE